VTPHPGFTKNSSPSRIRVVPRLNRSEIPIRLLLADPFEEGLKLWRDSQRVERGDELFQLDVREGRVQLLVARFAKRYPLLGLPAARLGMEVMERNQVGRNFTTAQSAAAGGWFFTPHKNYFAVGNAADTSTGFARPDAPTPLKSIGLNSICDAGKPALSRKSPFSAFSNIGSAMSEC